jgi:hypothetical protein
MSTKEVICKHCNVKLVLGRLMPSRTNTWLNENPGPLSQYCWADPVLGSQLHEPVEPDLNAEITKIWEKYDHTTFNQQSVAIAFAKEVRAIKV